MNVFDISAKIGLDTKDYADALGNASSMTKNFGSLIKDSFASAAQIGAAALSGMVTETVSFSKALVEGVSDLASFGDHIDKQSQKMNMSAEAYQEWDAIMQHSGTTIDSMQSSMKTLATAVETGNDAFKQLGFTEEELATLNNEQLFSKTITALQNVESDTERTYLAGQLLGRGATELGALLNTSAEDTEKMRQRVHELGGVMSDEAVKDAAKYKDSLQDMQTALSGMKKSLTTEFLPSFTYLMDGMTKIFAGEEGGENMIAQGIDNIVDTLTASTQKLKPAAAKIGNVMLNVIKENAPKFMQAGVEMFASIGTGIVQSLPQMLDTGIDIMASLNETLRNWDTGGFLSSIADQISSRIPTVFRFGRRILESIADDILHADFGKITSSISTVVKSAIGNITNFVQNVDWHLLGTDIADGLNGIDWKAIMTKTGELIGAAVKAMPDLISGIFENLNFDNASYMFAMLFTPKLATSLIGQLRSNSAMLGVNDTLSEVIGGSGTGAGTAFFSKFSMCLEAAALGWNVGTFIRNLIGGEKVDKAVESVLEDVRLAFTGTNLAEQEKAREEANKYHSQGSAAQMVRDAYEATGHDARGRYATGGIINHTVYDRYGNMFGEAGREAILPLDSHTEWMDGLVNKLENLGNRYYTLNIYANSINSEADFDILVEKIDRKLSERNVSQGRAVGAVGWA